VYPGMSRGSPLSPVLFNVYTLKITKEQSRGPGRTLSYADGVLMYRQGKNREEVAAVLQVELKRIQEWCSEASTVVNPTKAEMTWFR
jgi:hypothetical protein